MNNLSKKNSFAEISASVKAQKHNSDLQNLAHSLEAVVASRTIGSDQKLSVECDKCLLPTNSTYEIKGTTMKRSEILANRQTWIEYLKGNRRRKAVCALDEGNGARCCLGHGAYVLGVKRVKVDGSWEYGEKSQRDYSSDLMHLVGLVNERGDCRFEYKGQDYSSLADLNDETEMRPREIGEYLESVIDGGKDTPFIPLKAYEE